MRRSWSAYEIKFLLDEAAASEVQARLAGSLRVDPYCGHAPGGSYRITSLACDSAAFGVFFRDEAMRNRKYRVRRYGAESVVYLERKRSRQGKVRKRRCTAGLAELEGVVQGGGGDAGHAWFTRELRALELGPVCRVTYLRRALYGETGEGPVRVTFDREIDGVLCPAWSVEAGGEARRVLEGRVVCEFKFENAMPSVLKQVVAAMRLEAVGVSKYRACVRAFAPELGVDLSREVAAVNGAGVVPVASVGAGVGVADA
ncbi:MAG TPA: polyphosphate polymerase domain-containing protein [Phycisphaerales bacterium]|nr:polyphosphate polymerase domain-containing protein [Phycisphaerales bacterium]